MALSSSYTCNVNRRLLLLLLQRQHHFPTIDYSHRSPSLLLRGFASNATDEGSPELSPLTTPKLFISGLSRLTTDEKLKSAFSPYGTLLEAKVSTDRVTGRSRGFGFVRYLTIEEAEKAREGMNAKFLDGWVIFVDPAKPRAPKPRPQPEPEQPVTGVRVNKTIGWCG